MTKENYIGIRLKLAQIIKGTAWEGHVFLVGGCVRDDIMHTEIHDIDIAVDKVNGGIKFVRWLEKKHFTARGKSVQVFEHFGTAKVKLKAFPTEVIDSVQTRKDKYVYEKEPHPEINFGTIKEDSIRRDLTINSLYVNISTGGLLDPTGFGLNDIENHIIRTPNDPDETFTDNPMHVLRCVRFAVKYGWDLSPEIIEALKRNVGILAEATTRRLCKEVSAILDLKNKDIALQIIEQIGAKEYVDAAIEMLDKMKELGISLDQPKRHHHHHRGGHRKNALKSERTKIRQ